MESLYVAVTDVVTLVNRRLAGGGGACVAPEGHLARRLGGGGCNIFQEPIDLTKLTHSILLVVVVTVVFEQLLHQLTHFLEHNSLHEYQMIVGKVTGELMILGFISFSVLMTIQFGSADKFVQAYLLMFELAHVWIFTVGILYAIVATLWLVLGTLFKLRWTQWSAMDKRDVRRQVKKMQREEMNDAFTRLRRSKWCVPIIGPDGDVEMLEYHLFQTYFKTLYNGDIKAIMGNRRALAFDYSEFLTLLMNHTFVEQLEVDLSAWIALVVVIYACLFVRFLMQLADDPAGSTTSLMRFTTISCIVTNLIIVLMILVARWFRGLLQQAAYKAYAIDSSTPLAEAVITAEANFKVTSGGSHLLAHGHGGGHGHGHGGGHGGGHDEKKSGHDDSAHGDGKEHTSEAQKKEMKAKIATTFASFDVDGSGMIDGAETTAMFLALGFTVEQVKGIELSPDLAKDGLSLTDFTQFAMGISGDQEGAVDAVEAAGTKRLKSRSMSISALVGNASSLLKGATMSRAKDAMSDVKKLRFIPRILPWLSEVLLLVQVSLLGFVICVNLPAAISFRPETHVSSWGGPAEGYIHFILQLFLLLIAMIFLQPGLLKNVVLINGLLGDEHELLHMLYRIHGDVEVKDATIASFVRLIEVECDGSVANFRDAVPLKWLQKVQLKAREILGNTIPKPQTLGQIMTSYANNTTRDFIEGGRVTRKRLKKMLGHQGIHYNLTDFDTLWKFVNPRLRSKITVKAMQLRVQSKFVSKNSKDLVNSLLEIARERISKRKIQERGIAHVRAKVNQTGGDAATLEALEVMGYRFDHGLNTLSWMRNESDEQALAGAASKVADGAQPAPSVHWVMLGSRSCAESVTMAEKLIDSIAK